MLIFAASKGGQVALESAATGGLFTSAISDALTRDRPPSASIKLNDFYSEVKRNVLDQSGLARQITWFGRRGLFADFVMF